MARRKKDHAGGWASLSVGSWGPCRLEIGPVQFGDWARLIGPKLGYIGASFGLTKKGPMGLRPIQNNTDENRKKEIRYDKSKINKNNDKS